MRNKKIRILPFLIILSVLSLTSFLFLNLQAFQLNEQAEGFLLHESIENTNINKREKDARSLDVRLVKKMLTLFRKFIDFH